VHTNGHSNGRGYETFRAYTRNDLDTMPQLQRLPAAQRDAMKAVSAVLPFRTNAYVVNELIDWSSAPDDPMFQLTFPQAGMLEAQDLGRMMRLLTDEAPAEVVKAEAHAIRQKLNPHPAGQMELNVPRLAGEVVPGVQHKYRETVLFFPAAGQTCHAYCSYCFRWAQFTGDDELKFASRESGQLVEYLKRHPEVTSVLITGGDPMVMRTKVLRRYIEPLLDPALENLQTIRIGTKAPAYWPQRFVTDQDSDDLMRLFEEVRASGRQLALMAHYSHPVELSTNIARRAVARVQEAGAVVRCQAPLIRYVNDCADAWADLWRTQVRLGAVPYYMFVERDTGARNYFEVPLARASTIYNRAISQVSGLARTVRGPSMSATPGKVVVDGVATVGGERVFVLRFLQARNPEWVGQPFFAHFDRSVTWFDELRPAFGESRFFFEHEDATAPSGNGNGNGHAHGTRHHRAPQRHRQAPGRSGGHYRSAEQHDPR
jgi:KamA family protein